MQGVEHYMRCVDIDNQNFQELLDRDQADWDLNLANTKQEVLTIQERLRSFMEQQTRALQVFLKQEKLVKLRNFNLKKLPLWGEQVPAEMVNFQWPTEEQLEKSTQETYLASMTFKEVFNQQKICSVQCTLSDNVSSPVFEKEGCSFKEPCTVNFDEERPVKSIYGRVCSDEANCVQRIDFIDKEGKQIGQFDPYACGRG